MKIKETVKRRFAFWMILCSFDLMIRRTPKKKIIRLNEPNDMTQFNLRPSVRFEIALITYIYIKKKFHNISRNHNHFFRFAVVCTFRIRDLAVNVLGRMNLWLK